MSIVSPVLLERKIIRYHCPNKIKKLLPFMRRVQLSTNLNKKAYMHYLTFKRNCIIITGLNVGLKISVNGGRISTVKSVEVIILRMEGGISAKSDTKRLLFLRC